MPENSRDLIAFLFRKNYQIPVVLLLMQFLFLSNQSGCFIISYDVTVEYFF